MILTRLGNRDYATLSHPQLVVLAVDWLQEEVNNGGYHQYFTNSYSELADEALDGLREIGAAATAQITAKAYAVFPGAKVPKDQGERQAFLDQAGQEGKKLLEGLDTEFFKYPNDLDALLIAYIEKHKEAF